MKFSVLDLETTGFSPKMGDKIVEISIINIDEEGQVISSFESLVNPQRDLGPTWIHGVTADMVIDAPTFDELYPEVIKRINGGAVVAHNANFDLRFLRHECSSLSPDATDWEGICTLELSRLLNPDLPSHKLKVLCEYFDIELPEEHKAYWDCLSTKTLFTILKDQYIEEYGWDDFIAKYVEPHRLQLDTQASGKTVSGYKRDQAKKSSETSHARLVNMMERLPEKSISSKLPVQKYLNVLEDVLADRIITEEEAHTIRTLAEEYDISRKDVIEIHEEYLRRLVRIYLEDDVLSRTETEDLEKVAEMLGIRDKLDLMVELERAQVSSISSESTNAKKKIAGESVCFTGQFMSTIDGERITRSLAQELAMERGMKPKRGVTKKLDYLVVSDPHTQSSKAKKARKYGTKIIAEQVFWKMVGVAVD